MDVLECKICANRTHYTIKQVISRIVLDVMRAIKGTYEYNTISYYKYGATSENELIFDLVRSVEYRKVGEKPLSNNKIYNIIHKKVKEICQTAERSNDFLYITMNDNTYWWDIEKPPFRDINDFTYNPNKSKLYRKPCVILYDKLGNKHCYCGHHLCYCKRYTKSSSKSTCKKCHKVIRTLHSNLHIGLIITQIEHIIYTICVLNLFLISDVSGRILKYLLYNNHTFKNISRNFDI